MDVGCCSTSTRLAAAQRRVKPAMTVGLVLQFRYKSNDDRDRDREMTIERVGADVVESGYQWSC